MIDIYPGSQTHLNLLDLPDMDKLDAEDGDPIAQKSSLLIGFFENVLTEVTDAQVSIIDRVTHLTYERFQDKGRMQPLKIGMILCWSNLKKKLEIWQLLLKPMLKVLKIFSLMKLM